jgi:tRNA (mo5U34)-methyltransferase
MTPATERPARQELRKAVDRIHWFHRIDLGDGIVTPGDDESPRKLESLGLPASLSGKTVLDVGAWDGFFSFESERRGASRVVAVDPECWRPPDWGPGGFGSRAGFDLARRALGSEVEDVDIDLLDIGPESLGRFDVVLFLGVFYHLPDPWPYLDRVASVTAERLVIETHADFLDVRRPAMAYYPGTEIDGDDSNWWGPNAALLRAALLERGFSRVEVVHQERYGYRLARAARGRLRGGGLRTQQGRLVVHGIR